MFSHGNNCEIVAKMRQIVLLLEIFGNEYLWFHTLIAIVERKGVIRCVCREKGTEFLWSWKHFTIAISSLAVLTDEGIFQWDEFQNCVPFIGSP